MGSPRVDVVFRLWQCDKENHGWREGPPVTVLCQVFDLLAGPSPSRLNQFRTKTRILLYVVGRQPHPNIGQFKTTIRSEHFSQVCKRYAVFGGLKASIWRS